MIERKTWEEFRNIGLLWFINSILHMFGWAITYAMDGDEIKEVYPARVKFRGFSESAASDGYKRVSKYLNENSEVLYEESCE